MRSYPRVPDCAFFLGAVATINARALGRDQNGAVTDCEGSALRAPPPPFFPLITLAIMKAPYYYQLALWLVGSSNERTNGRTLRYHIP